MPKDKNITCVFKSNISIPLSFSIHFVIFFSFVVGILFRIISELSSLTAMTPDNQSHKTRRLPTKGKKLNYLKTFLQFLAMKSNIFLRSRHIFQILGFLFFYFLTICHHSCLLCFTSSEEKNLPRIRPFKIET